MMDSNPQASCSDVGFPDAAAPNSHSDNGIQGSVTTIKSPVPIFEGAECDCCDCCCLVGVLAFPLMEAADGLSVSRVAYTFRI